jgi:cell division protein FtsQ
MTTRADSWSMPHDFSRFMVEPDDRVGARTRGSKRPEIRVVRPTQGPPLRKKKKPSVWPKIMAHVGWFLLLCVIAGGMVYGTRWIMNPATLPIKSVRVEGELLHIDRVQIVNEVTPYASGGFFSVHVDDIHRALTSLPWIAHASVRRIWPSSIYVRVSEHQPVARWGATQLTTHEGVLFTPEPKTVPVGLPQLKGPEGSQQNVIAMLDQAQPMLQAIGLRVTQLSLSARRAWSIQTDKGIQLNLGAHEPAERLARFVKLYPNVLAAQQSNIARVDLRHPNGFAVAWRAPTTENAHQPAAEENL